MGACVTSAWAGLLVGPQLKQKRGNENGRLGQWAREGDRDGPPGAKVKRGSGEREEELGHRKKKRSRPFRPNKRKGEFSLSPLQFIFLFQNLIQI